MVCITALMDNLPSENKALVNQHGLSYLIQRGEERILFDCGAGEAPWRNAHKLGLSVSELDAVVLSHSHYDHAAGYRDLLEQGGGSKLLYTGPDFFQRKYAFDGRKYTDLSCGFGEAFLLEHRVRREVVTDVTEIAQGVYLVADFPRVHDFETIPARFVRRTAEGFIPDDFHDEICLALDVGGKLAVLVGCSHPGILNMIRRVHYALGMPVWAVFGGTHLMEADNARVKATVEALKDWGLEVLGLSHCSGENAECAIRQDQTVQSCHMAVGDCVFFP